VTRVRLVLVVPPVTSDLVVRRATRVILARLDLLALLATVVARVFRETLDLPARPASVVPLAPRVTLVRSVRLVAWV